MIYNWRRSNDIPPRIAKGIDRYVEYRIPTGGFLTAVLSNDLVGTFLAASDENRMVLPGILRYLRWLGRVPAECWGSPEKVAAWLGNVETRIQQNTLLRKASMQAVGSYLDAERDISVANTERYR